MYRSERAAARWWWYESKLSANYATSARYGATVHDASAAKANDSAAELRRWSASAYAAAATAAKLCATAADGVATTTYAATNASASSDFATARCSDAKFRSVTGYGRATGADCIA